MAALPRLVLFDVGNVLVGLRPWRDVLPAVGDASTSEEAIERFRSSAPFRAFELGRLGLAEFCDAVRLFFDTELADQEIIDRYRQLLGAEVAGMLDLIVALKSRGVRVAGLSDTCPIHLESLWQYPTVQELEVLLASCETGKAKPHPDTFRRALERLGATDSRTDSRAAPVRPGDVFFTDDLPVNVEGARRAGIRAEVFEGAESLRRLLGLD